MPTFPSLDRDLKVGTLVIGGGMAGLLCGRFLKAQGEDYAIIEKNTVAGGVTANTTGKITVGHGLVYDALRKKEGLESAAAYLAANTVALDRFRQDSKVIDCDFEEMENYIYTLNAADQGRVLAEAETLGRLGAKVEYTETVSIPLKIAGAVKMEEQAQFHPLKYAAAVAEGQRIFAHSFAGEIERGKFGYTVFVKNSLGRLLKIRADRIMICTHFPYLNRYGMYFMKLYQQRSYVLSLDGESLPAVEGMYMGADTGDLSFRTAKTPEGQSRVLLGGCGGRTGEKHGGFSELREDAALLFPGADVEQQWSAQDCMSLDHIPYVGPYAKHQDGLYVASGFNKWGMTGAMAAAMMLTGNMDPALADVFSTERKGRTMLKGQLFSNLFETTKNFLRPTAPRCTHLGCALTWNKAERVWDCACHGSSFTEDGRIRYNPAQKELRIK